MRSVFAIAALAASAAAIKLTQDLPTEGECKDFAKKMGVTEKDVEDALKEACPECETEADVIAFLEDNEDEVIATVESVLAQ